MHISSKIMVLLCSISYACTMDTPPVLSLQTLSIRAALATQQGRAALLVKPLSPKQQAYQELPEQPLISEDIKEDVACFLKKNPLLHTIFDAYENNTHPFCGTAVYVYDKSKKAFLKQGELFSLTPAQLRAIMQENYYYRKYIGKHSTRLSEKPQSIGAFVVGDDPDLKQKFEDAYQQQKWKRLKKWNVKNEDRSDAQTSVVYDCDAPGWNCMPILS